MSRDDRTAYGTRPRLVLFDELSLQLDNRLWTAMWSAIGKSPQAQLVAVSMAGWDLQSIGYQVRELGLDSAQWRDDPRLAELSYGDWEGSSWTEIEAHTPDALNSWKADPEGFCPPNGETHLDLRARATAVLADIVASNTRTVVVGHGVSGAVLRGLNLGLDARAMFVLEKPQDAFFRLRAGTEEKIATY